MVEENNIDLINSQGTVSRCCFSLEAVKSLDVYRIGVTVADQGGGSATLISSTLWFNGLQYLIAALF